MITIHPNSTLRELLPGFYQTYALDADGGQEKKYVKIEVTNGFYFYFPNFDQRRRAVLKHDLHHLVTGYPSTFKGETEISAWEVASGCKNYPAALAIDIHAMIIGCLFNFRGVFNAFVRGKRTENLYSDILTDEQAMDMTVAELQKLLKLDIDTASKKATLKETLSFLLWIVMGEIYSILSILLLPVVILYTIYIMMTEPQTD